MAQFLGEFLEAIKNRKYESYNSLISVHRTASYDRFVLCKKHKKKDLLEEKYQYLQSREWKKAVFRKMGKRGPRENLPNGSIF